MSATRLTNAASTLPGSRAAMAAQNRSELAPMRRCRARSENSIHHSAIMRPHLEGPHARTILGCLLSRQCLESALAWPAMLLRASASPARFLSSGTRPRFSHSSEMQVMMRGGGCPVTVCDSHWVLYWHSRPSAQISPCPMRHQCVIGCRCDCPEYMLYSCPRIHAVFVPWKTCCVASAHGHAVSIV